MKCQIITYMAFQTNAPEENSSFAMWALKGTSHIWEFSVVQTSKSLLL